MRTLFLKELRANLKLAALGELVFVLLLTLSYRSNNPSPGNGLSRAVLGSPLLANDFLACTGFFCGIFGAALGWWQVHQERQRDLWAFLVHRPVGRGTILLGKASAGLLLYALVVGLPLAVVTLLCLVPGHVPAPFEPGMVLPELADALTGVVYYLVGLTVGLRHARWYGSRILAVGLALCVSWIVTFVPEFWQAALAILIGVLVAAGAASGVFACDGYDPRLPAPARTALALAMVPSVFVLLFLAGALLLNLSPGAARPRYTNAYYQMTRDGVMCRVIQDEDGKVQARELDGAPFLDPKTHQPVPSPGFYKYQASGGGMQFDLGDPNVPVFRTRYRLGERFYLGATTTEDAIWIYSWKARQLLAYDTKTHRLLGTLGPQGFSPAGRSADNRFASPSFPRTSALLGGYLTATNAVYRIEFDRRSLAPVFTARAGDAIGGLCAISAGDDELPFLAVATRHTVELVRPDGSRVWQIPYERSLPEYDRLSVYLFDGLGRAAVWFSRDHAVPSGGTSIVTWISADGRIDRRLELPPLPGQPQASTMLDVAVVFLAPPVTLLAAKAVPLPFGLPEVLLFACCSAMVSCLAGLLVARRYAFPQRAALGWTLFLVLTGVPGFLALLAVHDRPVRERCGGCARLRPVHLEACPHCQAVFPAAAPNGTEIFAPCTPLVAPPVNARVAGR